MNARRITTRSLYDSRHIPLALALAIFIAAFAAGAQDSVFTLDPAHTQIEFTLDATLHTVHGSFQVKSGTVLFDPTTGKARGEIVVDSASGNSDNSSRDKKMHDQVLESSKFPEIVFLPERVQGTVAPHGSSQVNVAGILRLHGQDHAVTLVFNLQHAAENQLRAETQFDIPFISWGLKDPSNFMLRVGKSVSIHLVANGSFAPATP